MPKNKLAARLQKPVHPALSIAVIIIGIFGIALGAYTLVLLSNQSTIVATPPIPTPTPHIAQTNPLSMENLNNSDTNVPKVTHTFTSPNLGISFTYVDNKNSPLVVKEIGDKVYLNLPQYDLTSGKYVEVFSKNPTDTIEQAVQKAVMQGYSTQNCQIVSANPPNRNQSLNPTYQYARIEVAGSENLSIGDKETLAGRYCPPNYTAINTNMYFVTDEQHPDKFVFFSLGQDSFAGLPTRPDGTVITWDETIRFIDNISASN